MVFTLLEDTPVVTWMWKRSVQKFDVSSSQVLGIKRIHSNHCISLGHAIITDRSSFASLLISCRKLLQKCYQAITPSDLFTPVLLPVLHLNLAGQTFHTLYPTLILFLLVPTSSSYSYIIPGLSLHVISTKESLINFCSFAIPPC